MCRAGACSRRVLPKIYARTVDNRNPLVILRSNATKNLTAQSFYYPHGDCRSVCFKILRCAQDDTAKSKSVFCETYTNRPVWHGGSKPPPYTGLESLLFYRQSVILRSTATKNLIAPMSDYLLSHHFPQWILPSGAVLALGWKSSAG